MALMVARISEHKKADLFPKYRWLLYANLFTAYGMLFSFPFQGYGFFSILFSTLSIFASWTFAIYYWKDLDRLPVKNISTNWFKGALLFNALSALGAFSLAGLMVNKIIHQNWYLASIYFFLHFQYNGWFFFACMGLFIGKIAKILPAVKKMQSVFWLFAGACVPAFFLSALWLPIPSWLYLIVIISALAQVLGWVLLIRIFFKEKKQLIASLTIHAKWLLGLSAVALSVKLILQLGSTVPVLSTLAYGYRPIVIAYLHLISLGVITLFLLGYVMNEKMLPLHQKVNTGIMVFASGILLNELLLMVQGVAALFNTLVPFINELLLFAAAILFTGMVFLNLGIKKIT